MKYFSKITVLLMFATIVFISCKKKHVCENEVPEIEYKDFTIEESGFGTLLIGFIDCNGDIGLSQADSTGDFKFNLFMDYYEKQNGVWTKVDLFIPINYRIPVHSETGDYTEGDIELSNIFFNPAPVFDTIRYELYIKDKALNVSNSVVTREIIIPKQ